MVHVEEPSAEDTREILAGLGPRYEEHHGVTFQAEAYEAAVSLSTPSCRKAAFLIRQSVS